MRACAIDGRCGAGVHLENVHKLRAGNRHLTNLRNPHEMFRYRKDTQPRTPVGTINIMLPKVLVSYLKNTLTQSFNASISFAPISSLTECIERSGIPISTVFTGRSVDAIEPSVPPPRTSDLFTNL